MRLRFLTESIARWDWFNLFDSVIFVIHYTGIKEWCVFSIGISMTYNKISFKAPLSTLPIIWVPFGHVWRLQILIHIFFGILGFSFFVDVLSISCFERIKFIITKRYHFYQPNGSLSSVRAVAVLQTINPSCSSIVSC